MTEFIVTIKIKVAVIARDEDHARDIVADMSFAEIEQNAFEDSVDEVENA